MRKCSMLAILITIGCLAGCADFHATGPMAATIDAAALTAQTNIPRATAVSITDSEAVNILTTTASTFATFDAAKTTNPLAYFGSWITHTPRILVNAEYATRLDTDALLAAKTRDTALATPGQPTAWLNAAVLKESTVILDIQNAKKGVSVSK